MSLLVIILAWIISETYQTSEMTGLVQSPSRSEFLVQRVSVTTRCTPCGDRWNGDDDGQSKPRF